MGVRKKMEEQQGLGPNFFRNVDPRLPFLCVVYLLDTRKYHVWTNPHARECTLYLSPFFFWITWLFSQRPPISFMDTQWLQKLKSIMFRADAYTPTYSEKLDPLNVDYINVAESIKDVYPGCPWFFVYDNCVDAFHVTGSNPENGDDDSCPLICFLRIFLGKIGRLPPFMDADAFEQELFFHDSELTMQKAIVEWLRGGNLVVDEPMEDNLVVDELMEDNGDLLSMAVDEAQEYEKNEENEEQEYEENEEQENEDSKGKEDL
jgi:hypothetical protein